MNSWQIWCTYGVRTDSCLFSSRGVSRLWLCVDYPRSGSNNDQEIFTLAHTNKLDVRMTPSVFQISPKKCGKNWETVPYESSLQQEEKGDQSDKKSLLASSTFHSHSLAHKTPSFAHGRCCSIIFSSCSSARHEQGAIWSVCHHFNCNGNRFSDMHRFDPCRKSITATHRMSWVRDLKFWKPIGFRSLFPPKSLVKRPNLEIRNSGFVCSAVLGDTLHRFRFVQRGPQTALLLSIQLVSPSLSSTWVYKETKWRNEPTFWLWLGLRSWPFFRCFAL